MVERELIEKTEGLIKFYLLKSDSEALPSKAMLVFYNEKMILNRDISSLAIRSFYQLYKQDLIVVDSMAASGVSSIRLLKECQGIKKIYINDINPVAIDLIRKSLDLNDIDENLIKVIISRKDANYLFSEINHTNFMEGKVDREIPNVISIDPFGTPNIYINNAFNTIQKTNGLMCITATDTAVLHGVRKNACIRKYMSKPLHVDYNKEIGARVLLYFASRIANVNKIGITPLLTFSSGHFIRLFLLTYKSKVKILKDFKNFGFIVHCKCGYRATTENNILKIPKTCPICDSEDKFDYAGPLWIGELHDETFVKEIINQNSNSNFQNKKRLDKLLNNILEEINMPISYYNIHKLSQKLKLEAVPKMDAILELFKEKGFVASRTHFDPICVKTNMDINLIKQNLKEL